MTQEEKIKYLDTATRVAGYCIAEQDLDIIISLYDLILKKGGKADIETICHIKFNVEEKYKKDEQKEALKA